MIFIPRVSYRAPRAMRKTRATNAPRAMIPAASCSPGGRDAAQRSRHTAKSHENHDVPGLHGFGTVLETKSAQEDRPMRLAIIAPLALAVAVGFAAPAAACPVDTVTGPITDALTTLGNVLGLGTPTPTTSAATETAANTVAETCTACSTCGTGGTGGGETGPVSGTIGKTCSKLAGGTGGTTGGSAAGGSVTNNFITNNFITNTTTTDAAGAGAGAAGAGGGTAGAGGG
ncbi:MAG: hypothetical protein FJ027_22230, partial [Candidatus Rokubacteria bacterium]|nr:hypothetical protein [Candidatus Rokubacteria bacterium]